MKILYTFLLTVSLQNLGCSKDISSVFIRDNARVMSQGQVDTINKKIKTYFSKTKVKMFVYTISSIHNIESLEIYAEDLISKTDFGETGFKNSVILVVFPDEGSLFLRWGENLKKNIDNQMAEKLITTMRMSFSKNEFYNGIRHCVEKVYDRID